MKTQMMNILLVIGMLILLVSACGPIRSESAPEAVDAAAETPVSVPTEVVAEEPALPATSSYIGMEYPPLPFGFLQGFSLLIQDKDDYGLSLIADGGRRMLWLEKVSRYEADGSVIWEVKDVLDFSGFEPGLTLLPDGCFLNGTPDHEVFVVAKNGAIVLVWRANTTLEQFESIPVTGIACNSDKSVKIT